MAEKATGSSPITIKKYANRRLYNTAKSSYVTLDHLAEMVREGQDFVVFDAKSGEDITRSVLTQIIFEEEAKGQNMLPINFLRQLIRLYGDTLQGFVPAYLESSMEAFARNQEKMREQVAAAFGANPALANFEAATRANIEMFQKAMGMFNPLAGGRSEETAGESAEGKGGESKVGEGSGGEAKGGKPSGAELDTLKSQLAEMQAKLDKLARER